MTYIKRKIKNSQQPGDLTLPDASHVIILLPWKDCESSRKFLAQQKGLELYYTLH